MARIVRERGGSLVRERQQGGACGTECGSVLLGVGRRAADAGEHVVEQLQAAAAAERTASLGGDQHVDQRVDVASGQARIVGHVSKAGRSKSVTQAAARPARQHGKVQANGMVVTSVSLDEETYGQVWALAERDRTSFAQQIRLLIEWGLMADDGAGR